MKKYSCLCGGTATMKSIISIKSMTSQSPVYAWRIECDKCKAGIYDLRGSSTQKKAEEKFASNMKMAKSLAREFGVTPERFLLAVNN